LWSFDEQPPRTGDPLLPGASPAAIRDALLPDDRTAFDTACQDALAHTRESGAWVVLEVTPWSRIAGGPWSSPGSSSARSGRHGIEAADVELLTAFEPDQTKLMHFYLIRSDLSRFQHARRVELAWRSAPRYPHVTARARPVRDRRLLLIARPR